MPISGDVSPIESARTAGLRYVCDDTPGIRRVMDTLGFKYVGPNGRQTRKASELKRIRASLVAHIAAACCGGEVEAAEMVLAHFMSRM